MAPININDPGVVHGTETIGIVPTYDSTSRLFSSLNSYSSLIRPIQNQAIPIHVNASLFITMIYELDILRSSFRVAGYFDLQWQAELMAWNPANYDNLSHLIVPLKRIWTPELEFHNALSMGQMFDMLESSVHLSYTGRAHWKPSFVASFSCSPDLLTYPFDSHNCLVSFGARVSTVSDMTVNLDSQINTVKCPENAEFRLVARRTSKQIRVISTDVGPRVFELFNCHFHLHRRPTFLVINLMAPVMLLSLLCASSFLLHPGDDDKLNIAVTGLLSFTVFLEVINNDLPKADRNVPLILVYVNTMLATGLLTVLSNVGVRAVYKLGDKYDIDDFRFLRRASTMTPEQGMLGQDHVNGHRLFHRLSTHRQSATNAVSSRSRGPKTDKRRASWWAHCVVHLLLVALKEHQWTDLAVALNKFLLYVFFSFIFLFSFGILAAMKIIRDKSDY